MILSQITSIGTPYVQNTKMLNYSWHLRLLEDQFIANDSQKYFIEIDAEWRLKMLFFQPFLFLAFLETVLTIRPTEEILRHLENINYTNLVPPKSLPVQVSIQIGLYVLNEVDTRTQSFKLKFATRLIWHDERISFSDDFYQIPHLTQRLFWFPDVVVLNALADSGGFQQHLQSNGNVVLHYNGTIKYTEIREMLLSCPMDPHKFPFDTQYCKLEISVVGYYTSQVNFQKTPFTYETESGNQVSITGWKLVTTTNSKRH